MINTERVIVFIDGSNHYNIVKNLFKDTKRMVDFNFEIFIKKIVENKRLIRTYYYTAPLDWKKDAKTYAKQ